MLVFKFVVLHHCPLAFTFEWGLKDLDQYVFNANAILVNWGILKWLRFLLGFKEHFEKKRNEIVNIKLHISCYVDLFFKVSNCRMLQK